jgi:hypothetical protein
VAWGGEDADDMDDEEEDAETAAEELERVEEEPDACEGGGPLCAPEEAEDDDKLDSALVVVANFAGGSLTSPNRTFLPTSSPNADRFGDGVRGGEVEEDDEVNSVSPSSPC